MATGTKQCPYCAEDIRIEAKKCKHCGEMLEPIPPPLPTAPAPTGRKVQTVEATGKVWKFVQALGVFGVMVAAVAFFVSFYPDKVPLAKDWTGAIAPAP